MSCCGDRRRSYAARLGGPFARTVVGAGNGVPSNAAAGNAAPGNDKPDNDKPGNDKPGSGRPGGRVTFEYTGATSLIVEGPFSGRVYRFERPGARLKVDGRDEPALATVPVLRRFDGS